MAWLRGSWQRRPRLVGDTDSGTGTLFQDVALGSGRCSGLDSVRKLGGSVAACLTHHIPQVGRTSQVWGGARGRVLSGDTLRPVCSHEARSGLVRGWRWTDWGLAVGQVGERPSFPSAPWVWGEPPKLGGAIWPCSEAALLVGVGPLHFSIKSPLLWDLGNALRFLRSWRIPGNFISAHQRPWEEAGGVVSECHQGWRGGGVTKAGVGAWCPARSSRVS